MRRQRFLTLMVAALGTGACGHELDGPVPQPAGTAGIDPQGVCVEQLTTPVTLRGGGLSPLPIKVMEESSQLALPAVELLPAQDLTGAPRAGAAVAIPDDPANPSQSHVRWLSQRELRFDVFPELKLEPALYSVRATNRNGSSATWSQALLAVPRPAVEKIEPDLLCSAKGGTFTLTGTGFIHLGAALPKVTATPRGGGEPVALPVRLADCRMLPGSGGFESCTTLEVTVAKDQLAAGDLYRAYEIRVENPAPVGCHSTDAVTLTMVPSPRLDAITPELICTAQGDNLLTLTGSGFLHVGEATPTVSIGGKSYAAIVSDCAPVPDPKKPTESCKKLTLTIPKGDLAEGVHAVTVQNPPPADCVTGETIKLAVVPPPTVSAVKPGVVCDAGDALAITIEGAGFLTITTGATTALPVVTIGSLTLTPSASGCTPIAGLVAKVETCTTLTVTVAKGALPTGKHTVKVVNPAPAACSSEGTLSLEVVPPPTLTAVVPTKLCVGGGSLALTGTGFRAGISVSLGGYAADLVTVTSDTALSASFGALPLVGAGPFDVTVSYSSSCSVTLAKAVTIVPGPQLFFADPPVIYSGITNQITLYGSGYSGAPTAIGLRPAGSAATPVALAFTHDPTRPNQVQAVVPKGTAAGDYDVVLEDQTACDAVLAGGLKIVDKVTLKLTAIVPPFGHSGAETAVTVLADAAVAGGFKPVPRLYLNPVAGTGASAVEAVTFLDPARLTALVPKGLAVAVYDLIAVNPDGAVGLLPAAFKVTALPPPQLVSLSPGSISNTSTEKVKALGKEIRSPTASMECIDKNSGAKSTQPLTVTSFTATEVNLTVNASAYTNGAVCVVRITNDDGTYAEIPGLVITNPAQNLALFKNGPALAKGRRALGGAGSQATPAARFVYAIGGDQGSAQTVLDTVEVAPVDIFGVPTAFFTQHNRLKTARSFAPAVALGRCLYLVGGVAATGVLASVERACVLDPAQRPRVVDLDLDTSTTAGLGAGLWYYRVSAVMGAGDVQNPGGETLASEPFPVLLPALTGRKVVVKVHWSLVSGAAGYRVYRSPAAGAAADATQLIAVIASGTTTSTTDDGIAVQAGTPQRLGATGTWHTLAATLTTARQGAGAAIVPDPADATGAKHLLYVMGGKSASSALTAIEQAPISVNADGTQSVGSFTASSQSLVQARWQLGLFPMGNENASLIVPPKRFLYAGGGVATNGTTLVNTVQAFEVQAGGALSAPVTVNTMQPPRAGYGQAPANNFLYVFGGMQAAPDATVTSAKICGDASGAGACPGSQAAPLISNWNNASAKMLESRYLLGLAIQSGYFYLMGGQTGTSAASTTTEYSNW
jgi:hypothetical protein